MDPDDLIGMTEEDATQIIEDYGYTVRVINNDANDEDAFWGTCDQDDERVKITIEDGKVIEAEIG